MHCCAIDDLDPLAALRVLADEPDLVMLDGGRSGLLQWGVRPRLLQGLDELELAEGRASAGTSWPLHPEGGAVVQLDYELPVGGLGWRSPGFWALWAAVAFAALS